MIGSTSQTFKMGGPTTAAVMQYFCHFLSWSSTHYARSLIDWSNGRSFETWQCFCGSPLLSMAFGLGNHWDRWLSAIGKTVRWSSYGFRWLSYIGHIPLLQTDSIIHLDWDVSPGSFKLHGSSHPSVSKAIFWPFLCPFLCLEPVLCLCCLLCFSLIDKKDIIWIVFCSSPCLIIVCP